MIYCIIAIEQLLENIDFISNNTCYGYYSTFENLICLFVPLTVQIIVARKYYRWENGTLLIAALCITSCDWACILALKRHNVKVPGHATLNHAYIQT